MGVAFVPLGGSKSMVQGVRVSVPGRQAAILRGGRTVRSLRGYWQVQRTVHPAAGDQRLIAGTRPLGCGARGQALRGFPSAVRDREIVLDAKWRILRSISGIGAA